MSDIFNLDLREIPPVKINNPIIENDELEYITYENSANVSSFINNGTILSRSNNFKGSTDRIKPDNLDFLIPSYGVQDFINERALWQKGIHNLTGEPGWFYFKIFFNFSDQKGLFGGIMTDSIPSTCALRYLHGIRNYYKYSKIKDRILALARFTYTLSYINSISPWFFMGLNGINKLNELYLTDFDKEKSIDIICDGDSIDMRLNTLLDMYKYACYDEINQKEIIPQNLREFDMSIVIMNAPIKYFQTAIITSGQNAKMNQVGDTLLNKAINGINSITNFINGSNGDKFNYKNIQGNNNSGNKHNDRLSFQLYELKNCEIDPQSFSGYTPSNVSNSQFFNQGKGAIKINYDRCYKVTYNEWSDMMFSTLGILYDEHAKQLQSNNNLLRTAFDSSDYRTNSSNDINNKRINAINKSIYNTFFNKDTDSYKGLIDFSEAVIQDSLINVNDPKFLGNINENYDENNYEDLWNKTKNKIKNFFSF